MKVVVNENSAIKEIEVIINCPKEDYMVRNMLQSLKTLNTKLLCKHEGEFFQLDIDEILYIESVDNKTFIYTKSQIYETPKKLYELERYLGEYSFFRVSKSIIVNMIRVQSLRPELGARLLLTMDNEEKVIVSRQYAREIKVALEVL